MTWWAHGGISKLFFLDHFSPYSNLTGDTMVRFVIYCVSKVESFWKSHKIWKSLPHAFDKLCFLLKFWISELLFESFFLFNFQLWSKLDLKKEQLSNTLSFYGSKIILDNLNHFGWVTIVLDGSISFYTGPTYVRKVWFVPDQNNFYCPKSFRTRHKGALKMTQIN